MTDSTKLQATYFLDFTEATVKDFISKHIGTSSDPSQQVIALYYAVRDEIRYDPYSYSMEKSSFKASSVIAAGRAWCVPKANLYCACCRALGIQAQLGYADVRNHLSTERMRKQMGTNIFYWHGYVSLFLNEKWVKATPAFNIELTEKFGLKPLEFDGTTDSLYHEFDKTGTKHMEYINERGVYDDFPHGEMVQSLNALYPNNNSKMANNEMGDFEKDVEREVGRH